MVITMVAMLMVQTSIHDIANVVAMWYGVMSTAFAMNVVVAVMSLVALIRVLLIDF